MVPGYFLISRRRQKTPALWAIGTMG
jgi:hypothetical protein